MGFDDRRVIEVFAKSATDSGRVGSGYRVTATAILTAGHVVAGLPVGSPMAEDSTGRCEVRPLGTQDWISGSVLWRDESADVALIGLPANAPPLPPGSPMPRWGVVGGADQISCMAVGFPGHSNDLTESVKQNNCSGSSHRSPLPRPGTSL